MPDYDDIPLNRVEEFDLPRALELAGFLMKNHSAILKIKPLLQALEKVLCASLAKSAFTMREGFKFGARLCKEVDSFFELD